MKQRPLICSTPMVQSINIDLKTITRRLNNLDTVNIHPGKWSFDGFETIAGEEYALFTNNTDDFFGFDQHLKVPWNVGDVLWIRENFKPKYVKGGLEGFKEQYPGVHPWFYMADRDDAAGYGPWKPSIHMPRDAARIFLEVTEINVERLHDICEDECKQEGVEFWNNPTATAYLYRNYLLNAKNPPPVNPSSYSTAYESFMTLWIMINGVESWERNPWVFVITFKKTTNPELKAFNQPNT